MHAALKGQDLLEVDLTEAGALPAANGPEMAQEGQASAPADHAHPPDAGHGKDVQADAPKSGRGRRASAKQGTQQPTAKRKQAGRKSEQQQQQHIEQQVAAGNGVHVETEEI